MEIKPEAVLFDLDGVLVDACEWHYNALNMALSDYKLPIIDYDTHITKYNGLPTKVKLQMLGISNSLLEKINNDKQKYTLEIIKNSANIMEEKIKLHEFLKKSNIKIVCVTNSIHETAKEMLIATGQMPYIDLLVTNEIVSKNKPYPDCYNYAIEFLKLDPFLTICVEDSPKGIEAAKNSMANYLWVVNNSSEVTLDNYYSFIKNTNMLINDSIIVSSNN